MRNYKKEAQYEDTPQQVKNREARNRARRQLAKEGLVKKGDGKDVGHIRALGKGGAATRGNVEVQTVSANRSFARTPTGAMRSEVSKRERRR
jgi:hypothetical protein